MPTGNLDQDGGFTLLEVLIAAVVMAIILMGLISSITGSFIATDASNKASESQATARQLLEEAVGLNYGEQVQLADSATVTADGLAAKYQVYETAVGLLTVEVEVCRPLTPRSADELHAMTMPEFHALEAVPGSRVRFTTLSCGFTQRLGAGSTEDGAVADGGTGTDNGTTY